jgi:hypothetical protein
VRNFVILYFFQKQNTVKSWVGSIPTTVGDFMIFQFLFQKQNAGKSWAGSIQTTASWQPL